MKRKKIKKKKLEFFDKFENFLEKGKKDVIPSDLVKQTKNKIFNFYED